MPIGGRIALPRTLPQNGPKPSRRRSALARDRRIVYIGKAGVTGEENLADRIDRLAAETQRNRHTFDP